MDKIAFDLQELAGNAAKSALAEVGNLQHITERPFEILFKYVWPGLMLLKGKWVLALFMGAAQSVFGIGPETLGAWIDRAIGKGPGTADKQISESSLENVSGNFVTDLIGGLFSKSSAFRTEVLKRGDVDAQSLIVAWANGPDKIEKTAVNIRSKLRQFFAMSPNGKGLITGALYSLLKALLAGVTIQTGMNMLLGGAKTKLLNPNSTNISSNIPTNGSMRLYTNPVNNVEKSLIIALDNTVKDKDGKPFSKLFMDLKGYTLLDSPEMDRVLGEVRSAHGGASIDEINKYKTFGAPEIGQIAKMLLPQATYNKNVPQKQEVESRIGNILGGKNG